MRNEYVVGQSRVSALRCSSPAGTTESGKAISFNDPDIDRIHAAAKAAKTEPNAVLELRDKFGGVAGRTSSASTSPTP